MHHVAIMDRSKGLISKILSDEKIIESRWYQTRRTPWNRVKAGDRIFFKDSGKMVTAEATVSKVIQFLIKDLTHLRQIVKEFGEEICLINKDPATWGRLPKYCVLIYLKNPQLIKSFEINKNGFGTGAAWLTIKDIQEIKI